MDLIDVANREGQASLILSLDAKKAFDHLGWPFLFATLCHMGFRGAFLRAIHHLYTDPSSQVRTPYDLSFPFLGTNVPDKAARSPLYYLLYA